MASIGQKLETKGVIMALLTLVVLNTGCEDKIDPPAVNPSEGETVEVTLNIGIADEEDGAGASASPTSKAGSNSGSALEVVPVSDVQTKSGTDIPDQFYNLEIIQYNSTGSKLKNQTLSTTSGTTFTASLQAESNCKLLLIAHGSSNYFNGLSGKTTLNAVRSATNLIVEAKTSSINGIATDATGSALANMPYYLLLEDVNIIYEDSRYKIQSPTGKDVRLLLKRLAAKVQLDWILDDKMTADNYTLKEVKLCQVPAHYRLIPQTESTDKWGEVYPGSVAEFVDVYRLTGTELTAANGTKTVWIPANARGISSYSNSPYYRNKTNANPAATYAEFVVDNSEKKERLYYRVYLGGNETDDFNLLENTNYHWTVKINKADYANDPRIQLLDQTPVESTNEQLTSNCFMMLPGTNICFNPYKHEAGTDGWNTYLTSGGAIASGKTITSVKVLWQTKDAGTSGDLVMGYVIDKDKHENLVHLTEGDNVNNARIHIKVPTTQGGNAVVAAYNGSTIVWSWHIWISDYVPATLKDFASGDANARQAAISTAKKETKGGTVHTYDGDGSTYTAPAWTSGSGIFHKSVIMDRNLGAIRNTFSTASTLDAARAYGNIYEWGRKDPFTGSVDGSNTDIDVLYDGEGNALSFKTDQWTGGSDSDKAKKYAIEHPDIYVTSSAINTNTSFQLPGDSWITSSGSKGFFDPCPKGWRVPNYNTENTNEHLFKAINDQRTSAGTLRFLRKGSWYATCVNGNVNIDRDVAISNGFLYYPKTGTLSDEEILSNEAVWFPAIRLRESSTGELRKTTDGSHVPSFAMWGACASSSYMSNYMEFKINNSGNTPNNSPFLFGSNAHSYGFGIRCIQDRK